MKRITIKDNVFRPFISTPDIENATREIAVKLNDKYQSETEPVVFLTVLNGAVPFAANLFLKLKFPVIFDTVKISSYSGTERGEIKFEKPPSIDLNKKRVIIVEDIIDSGQTIDFLKLYLETRGVTSVSIVSLLLKPEVFRMKHPDFTEWGMITGNISQEYKNMFIGISISDDFVVGYGLDYDGLGRNLNKIYILDEE